MNELGIINSEIDDSLYGLMIVILTNLIFEAADMNEINRFIDISNEIGSDVAFVQAGGGNTSVKLSTKEMLIKSSGIYLKDMTPNSGFCNVNFPEIKKYHYNLIDDEEKYSQKLNESVIKGVGRPSMETGFHALIPHKYVIHSHPVYLNVPMFQQGEI